MHCKGCVTVFRLLLCCDVSKSPPGRCPRRDLSVGVASLADTGGAIRSTDTATTRRILMVHGLVRLDLIKIPIEMGKVGIFACSATAGPDDALRLSALSGGTAVLIGLTASALLGTFGTSQKFDVRSPKGWVA